MLELFDKSRQQYFHFDSQGLPEGAGKGCSSVRMIFLTFLGMLKKKVTMIFFILISVKMEDILAKA